MSRMMGLFATMATVVLLTPAPTFAQVPPPAVAEGAPIVIGRTYGLTSSVLSDERAVAVYLPRHYDDATRRFPVIYLLDGGPDEDFPHISGLAEVSAAYGTTAEVIIIGIQGKDRRHDLTSPTTVSDDLLVAPTSGGAAAYRRFLVEELRPWVDARYRTNGHAALMGESLAGLFVVETALRSPEAFDDYIAVSPSLWWSGEALSREATDALRASDFSGRRLWLADADERSYSPAMKDGMDRLVAALQAAGARAPSWSYAPMPQETHATIYHPAALAALRALYRLAPVE